MDPSRLIGFIAERECIRVARISGQAKPWTQDPILQNYRFTNVRREDDKVTKWVSENWRVPNLNDPHLWFAMCVACLFNNPNTLANIGYQSPFNPEKIILGTHAMKVMGSRVFNPAYVVSTNGVAMEKVEYLVTKVLTPLWAKRDEIRPRNGDTIEAFAKRLTKQNGFKGFMAGQVCAYMKYVQPLDMASDWMYFALSGPGSKRGMNRVCGHDVESGWHEKTWHTKLMELQTAVNMFFGDKVPNFPALHAQDLQNCLCEFDKYERSRLCQGKPKQRYEGVV